MRKNLVIMLAVAALAAVAGYFAAMLLTRDSGIPGSDQHQASVMPSLARPEDLIGQRRPDYDLIDTSGNSIAASDYDGLVTLVNFWATWCKPCVEEMPMLTRLQREFGHRGFTVVGIALDDAERAAEFAASLGVSYPILVGQTEIVLTGRRYGNGTGLLPYSVLIDSNGIIRWTHLGALTPPELEGQIKELLSNANL